MSIPPWARTLYREARKHSSRRAIPFEITLEEFGDLVERSAGRCMLTGIAFEFESVGAGVKRPFAPSLDRLDSKGAYRIGNLRLVCVAVNLALNQWGDGVLMKVAKGLVGALSPEEAAWQRRAVSRSRFLPGVRARVGKGGRVRYYAYKMDNGRYVSLGGHPTESDAYQAVLRSAGPNLPLEFQ